MSSDRSGDDVARSDTTVERDPSVPDIPDLNKCKRCGDERDGHSYLLVFGDWNPDRSGFERPPGMRPLCRDCWTDEYARTSGAHWSIDDPQRVWDVLRASDGELVADLSPLFMGGRPFVRVDGDANMTAVGPTLIDGGENDAGTPVIEEKIVRLESFDRDALFEAIETGRDLPNDTGSVIIRPIEETPFERYTGRGENSASLGRWSE
ncbi:hypothetical protein [Halorubrum lacusprofundi]|uniref:hypothetical protein n=1 Tax=Halorubrum lacusprofundi TaxID=2247 RepID=UPI00197AE21E|nr:hypothetical protein [Halorubrum lacusprofundi]MCG1008247.1 hypothetical protein [Halorubrum lacusprofundi]